ncbi:MAG: hypothetical protein HY554_14550 [Elusimicrobia bacterium]|nr:hypothetical protein [Elusimicrobiota bacterium]
MLPIPLLLAAAFTAGGAVWPRLDAPPAAKGGGEADAAVVVGVERYVFVAPVEGARANASAWYDFLVRTRKTPAANVTLLRDEDATLEALREAAAKAAQAAGEKGRLWFVFIGHGAPAKDGSDGVLVGVDAQQRANSLYARSLPQRDLLALLSKTRAASIQLVLDACFSGRAPGGQPLVPALQPLVNVALRGADDPRATVLTAARADQFAGPLPGGGRPAFSYLVLGGLRGWADLDGDGRVTAGEAHRYSADALRSLLRDREQTPSLEGREGAVLSAGSEAGPDIAAIASGAGDAPRRAAPSGELTRVLLLLSEDDRGTPAASRAASQALALRLKKDGLEAVSASVLKKDALRRIEAALADGGGLGGAAAEARVAADAVLFGALHARAGATGLEGLDSCIVEAEVRLVAASTGEVIAEPAIGPVKGFGPAMERACRAAFENAGKELASALRPLLKP